MHKCNVKFNAHGRQFINERLLLLHRLRAWPVQQDDDRSETVGLKSNGTTGQMTGTCRSIRHGPLSRRCLCATDTRRDTGPWRCSSDGTDDETRLIVRRYVVRHHVFNLKLRFVHQ